MGFAGDEPQVPSPVKLQLAAQLRRWADIADLKRVVVSHGDVIEDDPQEALPRLAAGLD